MAGKSSYYPVNTPIEFSYNDTPSTGRGGIRQKTIDEAEVKEGGEGDQIVESFSTPDSTILQGLANMVSQARAAEIAFLNNHNFGVSNTTDWSELIKGFNYVLSNKSVFERNVSILKRVADKKDNRKTYTDITATIIDVVRPIAQEIVQNNLDAPVGKLATIVLTQAIEKLKNTTEVDRDGKIYAGNAKRNEGDEEVQAFLEMFSVIQVIEGNKFFTNLVDVLRLDNYILELQNYYKNGQTTEKPKLKVKGGATRGKGSILEYIEEEVIGRFSQIEGGNDTMHFKALNTGGYGHKADTVYTSSASVLNNYDEIASKHNQQSDIRSKRVRYINAMEELLNNITEAESEIVFVSDKSYTIRSGGSQYGGFTAEGNPTLENAGAVLKRVGADVNVEALQNYLGNTGPEMVISQPDDGILKTLATQIGYFMFDDLSIKTPDSKVGRIHVFNLSGVYMPFSVVLDGIQQAVSSSMQQLNQWANVEYIPGGGKATKFDEKSDFIEYRNTRLRQSHLSFHFMNNFAQFISSQIQI